MDYFEDLTKRAGLFAAVSDPQVRLQMLDAMAELSPSGIGIFRVADGSEPPKLAPVYVNRQTLYMLRLTKEEYFEIASEDSMNVIHPDDRRMLEERTGELLRGEAQGHKGSIFRLIQRPGEGERFILVRGCLIGPAEAQRVLCIYTDVTSQKLFSHQVSEVLKVSSSDCINRCLMKLIQKSSVDIYEVDIAARRVIDKKMMGPAAPSETETANMPESLLASGRVHKDSVAAYKAFFDRMYAGLPDGQCMLRVKMSDGHFALRHYLYETVFMETGLPSHAIVIAEDVRERDHIRFTMEQYQMMIELVEGHFNWAARVNISANKVEELTVRSVKNAALPDASYDDFLQSPIINASEPAENIKIARYLSSAALLEEYEAGRERVGCDYRAVDKEGRITWTALLGRLCTSPASGDIYLFIVSGNCDVKKKAELHMSKNPVHVTGSGFYDMPTLKALVQDGRMNKGAGSCAIVSIHFLNLAELRTSLPERTFDLIYSALCRKIELFTGPEGFIAERLCEHVVIFLPEMESEKALREWTQKLFAMLSSPNFITTPFEQNVSFYIGAACMQNQALDFDTLFNAAVEAKNDATTIEPVQIGHIKRKIGAKEGKHFKFVYQTDNEAENSEGGQLFSEYARLLAASSSQNTAIDAMLSAIGSSFSADKVYVLKYDAQGALEIAHEWNDEARRRPKAKRRFAQPNEMKSFELSRESHSMFMLENISKMPPSEERAIHMENFTERLAACPLIIDCRVAGFVAVANPLCAEGSIGVIKAASRIIAGELQKAELIENERRMRTVDQVSGALARSQLSEYFLGTNVETFSSACVFMADIIGLASINEKYGMSVGDQTLKRTASLMKEAFGDDCVYRYGDSILLACPQDLTAPAFNEKAAALETELDKSVIYYCACGYTWSDKAVSVNSLLSSANMLMLASKRQLGMRIENNAQQKKSLMEKELTASLHRDEALLYLQPKIDAATGEICGAEALVRMRGKEGGVILPGSFIPVLEEVGLVHYIDKCVLQKAINCLASWQRSGKKAVPISVNFSRQTFIEPDAAGLVKNSCTNGGVETNVIEIEITESLGDIETQSISMAAEKFAEAGIGLELDDFGAKYSNVAILGTLPFKALKLDKTLIDHITDNKKMMLIAKNIIALCHEQGIVVVAEGVEKREQLELLRDIRCDQIQGYLINKPLPAEEFAELYIH